MRGLLAQAQDACSELSSNPSLDVGPWSGRTLRSDSSARCPEQTRAGQSLHTQGCPPGRSRSNPPERPRTPAFHVDLRSTNSSCSYAVPSAGSSSPESHPQRRVSAPGTTVASLPSDVTQVTSDPAGGRGSGWSPVRCCGRRGVRAFPTLLQRDAFLAAGEPVHEQLVIDAVNRATEIVERRAEEPTGSNRLFRFVLIS